MKHYITVYEDCKMYREVIYTIEAKSKEEAIDELRKEYPNCEDLYEKYLETVETINRTTEKGKLLYEQKPSLFKQYKKSKELLMSISGYNKNGKLKT